MKERNSRIAYDKHFVTTKGVALPKLNNREIDGLSLFFQYRYIIHSKQYNEDIEILFPNDGCIQPECFFSCCYNRELGYKMELRKKELNKSIYSKVDYLPDTATIWYADTAEPKNILFAKAVAILREHPECFDNPDNFNAQNLAYHMVEK